MNKNTLLKLKNEITTVSELSEAIETAEDKLDTGYLIQEHLEYATDLFAKCLVKAEQKKCFENEEATDIEQYNQQTITAYRNFCNKIDNGNYSFTALKNNGYLLTLPVLLNRHKKNKMPTYSLKNKYIYNVAERLIENNLHSINKLAYATIVIESHFTSKGQNKIIRDNDNADAHDIINLINRHFMKTDDDGLHINIIYDTKIDTDSKTCVYIIPQINITSVIQSTINTH